MTRGGLQPGALRIWKMHRTELHQLGLSGAVLTDAGSTLANFILGSAVHHSFDPRPRARSVNRTTHLQILADLRRALDSDPLIDGIATHLSEHNDRDQFLAGVDIILRGITGTAR